MKNKKIIIISSVIIVMILFVLVVAYFTTDFFKTNKQLFCKYIKNIKIIDNEFITQANIASNKIIDNTYASTTNINLSMTTPNQETGISDIKEILSINSKGLKNNLLKQSYRDFVFTHDNKDLLPLKYLKDNDKYGLFSENIVSKYLTVQNLNLKELFGKLGVQDTINIPDSISINFDEFFKIDKNVLESIKVKYSSILYNSIEKDNFYKISNSDKTQTLSLSLTEQELYNLIKTVLENVKEDSVMLNLINDKLKVLNYNNITIEDVQSTLHKYIDKISNNNYSNEKDFFKISFIRKDEQITKLQVELKENVITQKKSEQITNDNISETITQKNGNEIINNLYNIEIDLLKQNEIVISIKVNDVEINKIIFNYELDENGINVNIEETYIYEDKVNTFRLNFRIQDYISDNIIQDLKIDLDFNKNKSYQIIYKNTISIKDDVQISKLTAENSVLLNSLPSEELKQLYIALLNRINQVYGEDIEKILIKTDFYRNNE